jgi:hypothetical protein
MRRCGNVGGSAAVPPAASLSVPSRPTTGPSRRSEYTVRRELDVSPQDGQELAE